MPYTFNPLTGNFDIQSIETLASLGAASRELDNLQNVAINTSLISDTNATDDLGSSSIAWANGYIDTVIYNSTANIDGTVAAGFLATTGHVAPATDNVDDLGATTSAYRVIYARTIDDRDGIGGITFAADPIPNNTVRQIGSASADPWNHIYVNNVVGPTVFNEVGADIDFRFEGLNDIDLLFIDASTDRVGISTNTPNALFEVALDTNTPPTIDADTAALFTQASATGDNVNISLIAGATGNTRIQFGDTADENIGIIDYDNNSNTMAFTTNASEAMRIDSSGRLGIGSTVPVTDLHIASGVPTIRLSDSNAGTDQAVATLIELFRGETTNRVGFWGMASGSNDEMRLATDYANGEIVFGTGSNVTALTLSSAQLATFAGAVTMSGGTITGPSGTWDSGGMDIAASDSYAVAGTSILSDSAGTMTLSNIDVLDATTESTIEAAIDTLANLTAAAALVTVGTITTGVWNGTVIAEAYLPDASATAQGVAELATVAETNTGTDTARLVTPDGISGCTKSIMLSAAGGVGLTTAGAAGPTQVEAATNDINYWVLDYDTTTEEHAFWSVPMPDNWDAGVVNATFYWTNASGLTTETVDWGIAAGSYADSDAIDAALGTEVTTTDTWLAQGDMHISAVSSDITVANATAGEWCNFVVARKVATDDMAGDARLIAVKIEYTIDAYSE